MKNITEVFRLTDEISEIIANAASVTVPESRKHLLELATGGGQDVFDVSFDIEGIGEVKEATVTNCINGVAVNYEEAYMRRRDPECMSIGDNIPTDKTKYSDRYDHEFDVIRNESFEWFKGKDIILMPFISGDKNHGGYESIIIAPKNTAFFVGGLADLQGFIPADEIRDGFTPKVAIYLAPTFRHTHYEGKQVVVHNRLEGMHEVFSFNLYPGPSAKKGIYGVLLNIGEQEGWITAHASSVRLKTAYDNEMVIMHEGASGGGKSEMIEKIHRESDGRILLAYDTVRDENLYIEMNDTATLDPITDDMALCHPSYQNGKKLVISDAESGWFLRFDHIKEYGVSPEHEKLTTHPPEPLIFLNMQGVAGARILIWDHTYDEPGKRCPNPRVIMPRHFVEGVISEPVEVDIRSFGVRMPACTKKAPSYGIAGFMHVLPPALAWIWRLVSPRGFANPSIVDTGGMSSEGVGSYWPFATGKKVTQANLLLKQIMNTKETKYILIPNQHVGSYKVGFKAEWIDREYLARRGGAKFKAGQLEASRCSTLGYSLTSMHIDGYDIPRELLQTERQLSIGKKAYDKGAEILTGFFKEQLEQFLVDELDPVGRKIIEAFMNDAPVEAYEDFF